MAISGVPVQLFGKLIGTMSIADDGTMTLQTDAPDYGKNLLTNLEQGYYGGVEMTVMPVAQQDQDQDGRRKNRGKSNTASAHIGASIGIDKTEPKMLPKNLLKGNELGE